MKRAFHQIRNPQSGSVFMLLRNRLAKRHSLISTIESKNAGSLCTEVSVERNVPSTPATVGVTLSGPFFSLNDGAPQLLESPKTPPHTKNGFPVVEALTPNNRRKK